MKNPLLPNALNEYLDVHTHPADIILTQLEEETQMNVAGAHMISGHIQGNLLAMISKMLKPKCILEIGTYTGYSAICLAQGLAQDGILYSIEKDKQQQDIINRYWEASGMADKMRLLIGDAHSIIPELNIIPDLVFIDADKKGYEAYYDLLIDRLPSGGILLADNVLFNGEVIYNNEEEWSKAAVAMHLFNKKIKNDTRVEVVILPIRDGISLIRKR